MCMFTRENGKGSGSKWKTKLKWCVSLDNETRHKPTFLTHDIEPNVKLPLDAKHKYFISKHQSKA